MMTAADLTDFLIAEIEAADGDTSFVEQLLANAKAKILAGGGQIATLTSASLGGKNFARQVSFDAAVVARACRAALDFAAGNGVSSTSLDFSTLSY